jgi:hypothetical protein
LHKRFIKNFFQIQLRAYSISRRSMSLAQVHLSAGAISGPRAANQQTRRRSRANLSHDFRQARDAQRCIGFVRHLADAFQGRF